MVILSKIKSNKKLYSYSLIILCLAFFLLKLPFINHATAWDESVYLEMGKYIYSSGSNGLWEMIRPLGLPIITGAFWNFSLEQIVASRIFAIIISIGCIITTFFIAKHLFDRKHAIISAIILAFTPIFFYYSEYVLTDHISTLLILLATLMFLKDKPFIGGVFAGFAIWFKFTHIIFAIALIIFIAYKMLLSQHSKRTKWNIFQNKSVRKYLYACMIIILFVLSYFLSNYLIYGSKFETIDAIFGPYTDAAAYANNPYQNLVYDDLSSLIHYITYYPENILFNKAFGFLAYLFSIVYLIFVLAQYFIKKDKKNIKSKKVDINKHINFALVEHNAFVFIIFLTYLAYFTIIPYKQERFWVFFLPVLAIYSARGIMLLWDSIGKDNKFAVNRIITQILIIIIIIMFLSVSIMRISQFYKWNSSEEKIDYSVERYFDERGINGPIMTNDPRIITHSDLRYVAAYDILNKNSIFVNDWESEMDFNGAIYVDGVINCIDSDSNCITHKKELLQRLDTEFTVSDSYIYHGMNVTFYMRR